MSGFARLQNACCTDSGFRNRFRPATGSQRSVRGRDPVGPVCLGARQRLSVYLPAPPVVTKAPAGTQCFDRAATKAAARRRQLFSKKQK